MQIQNSNGKYNLDILGQNLQLIETNYEVHRIDIKDEIEHLYDHSNLEISRMNSSLRIQNETQSLISILKSQIEDSHEQFLELSAKSEKINKKLDNSKIDYIAILEIFASIVLGFVGSMAFSTSVLQNMKDVSIYRLIAVSCIIGMVFINIIWLLVYFILKLSDKKINSLYYVIFNEIFTIILFIDLITGYCLKGVSFF